MAGLYIHIPFCRTTCSYCDFYKTTKLELKTQFIKALTKEIQLRKYFLRNEKVNTIYFGGGTPSVLTLDDLNQIMILLQSHFNLNDLQEFTFEANPDDIELDYLHGLKSCGVNRMSFGVQSFHPKHLREITRRHSVDQAIGAVEKAKIAGLDNISLDLIYGLPHLSLQEWKNNVQQFLELNVPHLSAYHLIYEPGTRMTRDMELGRIQPVAEDLSHAQFVYLAEKLRETGYEHYEISNFAMPEKYSRHNSSYWKGIPYLGLGPSAHSFNGEIRSFNQSDLNHYISCCEIESTEFNLNELLTETDRYNEMIMLGLRTMWGLKQEKVKNGVSEKLYLYFECQVHKLMEQGKIEFCNGTYIIPSKHYLISDGIMSELFWVE